MDLLYVLDYRYARTPDGEVWTDTGYDSSFWIRYLNVFDRVRIISRVRDVRRPESGWRRVDSQSVLVHAVPYYLGPFQFLARFWEVRRAIERAVRPTDAVLLRIPSQLSTCAASVLSVTGHPYGVEVVGDAYEALAPGATRHPLRFFFRWWYPLHQRRQCARACAGAYVAERLQSRYPARSAALALTCSDVYLPDQTFRIAPRVHSHERVSQLITVGSLTQAYKGTDVLIDAVARCLRDGLDLSLTVVGDGKHRVEFETRAAALGIKSRISFLGTLPAGQAVHAQLDAAGLFVLPSRTEGMPRALLEAMARGLPCVASSVGGVPELLPPEDLVTPGDFRALAHKIRDIVTDPARMDRMSARNLEIAKGYRDVILQHRRETFYKTLRTMTEDWIGQGIYSKNEDSWAHCAHSASSKDV